MPKKSYFREVFSHSLLIAFSSAIVLKNVFYDIPAIFFVLYIFITTMIIITFNNYTFSKLSNKSISKYLILSFLKNFTISITLSTAITIYSLMIGKHSVDDTAFITHITMLIVTVVIPLSFAASYVDYQNSKKHIVTR